MPKLSLLIVFEGDPLLRTQFMQALDISTFDLIPYQAGTVNQAETLMAYLVGKKITQFQIERRLLELGVDITRVDLSAVQN